MGKTLLKGSSGIGVAAIDERVWIRSGGKEADEDAGYECAQHSKQNPAPPDDFNAGKKILGIRDVMQCGHERDRSLIGRDAKTGGRGDVNPFRCWKGRDASAVAAGLADNRWRLRDLHDRCQTSEIVDERLHDSGGKAYGRPF